MKKTTRKMVRVLAFDSSVDDGLAFEIRSSMADSDSTQATHSRVPNVGCERIGLSDQKVRWCGKCLRCDQQA